MKYQKIDPKLFIDNRRRFCNALKTNSIAIFHSNDLMSRNGDNYFEFKQNTDLFYLSGLVQEETVLVLFPDCPKGKAYEEIIFTKKTNEHIAIWEGYKYTKEDAAETSGIEKILWLEDMPVLLNELILLADHIYVNTNENDRAQVFAKSRNDRHAIQLREKYCGHHFERSQKIMKSLRMIKSPVEIEMIQKACDITQKAFERVLKHTKPGMMEYEIEAEIIYAFTKNAANGHAYNPIIAGGENACILHYDKNDQLLKDGELLLMDFGAEYANYAADLSRTIPINGKFTERQAAVYQSVLNVKNEAEKILRPGNNLEQYHKEVGRIMELELIGLGLLNEKDVKHQDPEKPLYKKYFMHGTSHHLGLDVHDLCNRYGSFQEGMVFTIEPGIYIPEEKIGIRLEDDILIGADMNINLMSNIPIEIEHIESLMQEA